jgi:hypothetical protein
MEERGGQNAEGDEIEDDRDAEEDADDAREVEHKPWRNSSPIRVSPKTKRRFSVNEQCIVE